MESYRAQVPDFAAFDHPGSSRSSTHCTSPSRRPRRASPSGCVGSRAPCSPRASRCVKETRPLWPRQLWRSSPDTVAEDGQRLGPPRARFCHGTLGRCWRPMWPRSEPSCFSTGVVEVDLASRTERRLALFSYSHNKRCVSFTALVLVAYALPIRLENGRAALSKGPSCGGGIAGHHRLFRLHLKAWDRPLHSGGEAQRLRSHREAVALEQRRTKVTHLAAFDHMQAARSP